MKKDDAPIIVEQLFDQPIDIVWNAITQIDLMRQWYFENIPAFNPEVGFETRFNVESQGRDFLHIWTVTEVVPLKKIAYDWKYDGYPGDSFVEFELFKHNNSTKLKLTHNVRESFPQDIPEFSRESGVQGWTFFITKRLKEFLGKQ